MPSSDDMNWQLPEVVLECIHADGVRLDSLAPHLRAVAFRADGVGRGLPWAAVLGRQGQPGFFERLISKPDLHAQISRAHFELSIAPNLPDALILRLLSRSPGVATWGDDALIEQLGVHHTALAHESTIGFAAASERGPSYFLVFRILLRSVAEVEAEGSHPTLSQAPAAGMVPPCQPQQLQLPQLAATQQMVVPQLPTAMQSIAAPPSCPAMFAGNTPLPYAPMAMKGAEPPAMAMAPTPMRQRRY